MGKTAGRLWTAPAGESPVDHVAVLELDPDALLARYRVGLDGLDPRVVALDEAQLDMAFLSESGVGRWPVRVVLGHLADSELSQTLRIRRALAEDGPTVEPWDVHAFVDSGLYGATPDGGLRPPIGAFLAAVHTLRRWNGATLMQLLPDQWERSCLHPEFGSRTVREMLADETWHFEHHAWYVNAKVTRLLGPAPEACDEPRPAGGCGAGCGCVSRPEAERG